jgi:phage terminase large subunit
MSDTIIVENNYDPTVPARKFHGSDARIQVLVGGLGSGKSYAVVKEIEQTAIDYPGIPMAMYRKTLPALRDSTLHEFREHVSEHIGVWRERDVAWKFTTGSFMNFRGLDVETKAKSTNYGLVVMEEAEEFTLDEFRRLNERVRSMRKEGDTRPQWPLRIILVLNPVDDTHWIYKEFVENAEEWQKAGGLDVIHFSTYDNVDNLPDGYIEQISVGLTPEEVDRLVNGMWGTIIKGEPVYANILNPDFHLRKMESYPGQTILRGWDFGFNHPAVSFRKVDESGRMNIAHEFMGEKIDLPEFVPQVINRTTKLFGPDVQLIDFGDPRGHDKSQSTKYSCFDTLKEFGINATGDRGSRSYVEEGIKQVKKEFSLLIEGIPKLTIDPSCSLIRAAYFGKYVRNDDGTPKKDGYYEHICDADRYISHHHRFNDAVRSAMSNFKNTRDTRRMSRNSHTGY